MLNEGSETQTYASQERPSVPKTWFDDVRDFLGDSKDPLRKYRLDELKSRSQVPGDRFSLILERPDVASYNERKKILRVCWSLREKRESDPNPEPVSKRVESAPGQKVEFPDPKWREESPAPVAMDEIDVQNGVRTTSPSPVQVPVPVPVPVVVPASDTVPSPAPVVMTHTKEYVICADPAALKALRLLDSIIAGARECTRNLVEYARVVRSVAPVVVEPPKVVESVPVVQAEPRVENAPEPLVQPVKRGPGRPKKGSEAPRHEFAGKVWVGKYKFSGRTLNPMYVTDVKDGYVYGCSLQNGRPNPGLLRRTKFDVFMKHFKVA